MKKWLCTAVLAFILLSNQLVGQAEWDVHFEDVSLENSHYSNIYYLADLGVIRGYPTTHEWIYEFKPSNDVTKRQVAAMLVRTLKLEGESAPDPGFVDVTKKDGAYNDIAIAVSKGFFKKGTHYKPGASITREEMAYALVRAFDLKGQSSLQFTDIPSTHVAYSDVQALAANGITTGNNGKFSPKANLTRAQFASFLTRAILPAARPAETSVTFGFVPEAEGKTYVYKLYHGGGYEELTYDFIRFDSYQGFNRSLLLTSTTDDYLEMGYFENNTHVQFDVPVDGYSRLFVLEYPLKAGTTFSFNEVSDDEDRQIMHNVDVYTTNGMYKANGQIFTNVTIAEDRFLTDGPYGEYERQRVFYIAQDVGIIAIQLDDAMLELDRIE